MRLTPGRRQAHQDPQRRPREIARLFRPLRYGSARNLARDGAVTLTSYRYDVDAQAM